MQLNLIILSINHTSQDSMVTLREQAMACIADVAQCGAYGPHIFFNPEVN